MKAHPLILASLSGVLCFLSFPRYDFEALAWIALVPLFLALENQTVRKSFWLGWSAGTVYFLGTVHWVTNTMIRYGKLPAVVSYPIMLLFVVYLGLYVAAFAALFVFLRRRTTFPATLSAPVLWVSLELLRTYALTGFPWAALGYSQYLALPVIQVADTTGVYGVSFLVVLVNVAVAEGGLALRVPRFRPAAWKPVATALVAVALVLGYGAWRLSQDRLSQPPTLRVGVVQANIPQDRKWDARFRQETIDRYERLSNDLSSRSIRLLVWPEAAMPFFFEEDEAFRQQVVDTVRGDRVPLLFGSPAVTTVGNQLRLFNSAYFLSADGRLLGRYDKMHLVPFGEYVPLERLLFFVNKMAEGIGDFLPGEDYTVMTLPSVDESQQTAQAGPSPKIATVICFEVIFPDLVRRFVKHGAQLMITITNDAWFGDSSAPYQHFSMVVLRAVENRVPFARAANTGVSGFIDRSGRIQKTSPIFVEAAQADALRLRTQTTFYTRHGDIFAYVCAIMASFMIYTAVRTRPQGEEFSYA
ncbi:MAG TPA: apolipoprotein N-acyltransferase [Nitrospiria bacterium]|nr:apolipoprotein N-acyltransferase [Nitrospiria bacterium]